ncbi:hypothetical protein NEFER03_0525 [Nematocida sp. LUAm3]|nr:hypothetical protein NEFER03_0525 [Nematocida sp. LUAm3]KAI5175492.1 hypothetical protein NEFER02_1398 [Nematocida sp. LUAm2]KAI5178478.1 hypothetical protein NEFER01_1625 [Nematocida sp. LUAm1]
MKLLVFLIVLHLLNGKPIIGVGFLASREIIRRIDVYSLFSEVSFYFLRDGLGFSLEFSGVILENNQKKKDHSLEESAQSMDSKRKNIGMFGSWFASSMEEDVPSDESIGIDELESLGRKAGDFRKSRKMGKTDILVELQMMEHPTRWGGVSWRNSIFSKKALVFCPVSPEDTVVEIGEYVAHEIAHVLGSGHDKENTFCYTPNSLMGPVRIRGKRKVLSQCSIRSIQKRIRSLQ